MSSHDMSETACKERAQHTLEHDQLVKQFATLVKAIKAQQQMVNINRDSIRTISKMLDLLKEEIECLKQDS